MSTGARSLVNLVLLTLAACALPTQSVDPSAPSVPPHRTGRFTTAQVAHFGAPASAPTRGDAAASARRSVWEPPTSPLRGILHGLSGAHFAPGYGQGLTDAIAALPAERRALGMSGLTPEQIANDGDSLCAFPRATATISEGGVDYDLQLVLPPNAWLEGPVLPAVATFSATCEAALLAAEGDVGATVGDGCTAVEERSLFKAGTDCRTCLEVDGDLQRCLGTSACAAEAVERFLGAGAWFDVYEAQVLACAPDILLPGRLLAEEGSATLGELPLFAPDWQAICYDLWDDDVGAATPACTRPRGGIDRDTVGDYTTALVEQFASTSGTPVPAIGRVAFFGGAEVDGHVFDVGYQFVDVFGGLSMTDRSSGYGWALPPMGWGDPSDALTPDDAGDWPRLYLAAASLKSASHISGIFVVGYSLNRCAPGGWSAPGPDGASVCRETGPWVGGDGPLGQDGWIAYYGDDGDIYAFPHTTLVGTGLPDPSIPGGFVPRVIGSTTLADAGWEGCTWPDTFTPDRLRALDTNPATRDDPYASFDAETWRFGRDDEPDAIMALATEQIREFCFEIRE
ncbi:MAG: hypothetical protein H6733_10845 [Alphaproteobacteria bacterium]|nr:hypothetical protein [Alphaproteobacteria bacterium]